MKKTLSIAIMATMIIAAFSGCGCEKTKTSTTKSTDDEATTHVEVVTVVTTDEQGNTYYEETTLYVADATVQTEADEKKAEEDTTSPTAAVKGDTSKTENNTSNTNNKTTDNKQTSGSASGSDTKQNSNTTNNSNNNTGSNTNKSTATNNTSGKNSGSGNTNSGSNNGNNSSNNNSSSQSSAADPHAGKTWHEAVYKTINHPAETKQVKVVDQEAYSYEEPIYEWRTFCNVCGADITEDCTPHMKAHALAREGGRYHDDYVQVGSETINVPEQSHMETVVVKEAWTEKMLVKEAGWY